MSKKDTYITKLRQSRTDHLRWLNQIKLLVSGIQVDVDKIEINASESQFGNWFYTCGMIFSTQNIKKSVYEIENSLTACFEIYLKIYSTLIKTNSSGFLSGMFASSKPSNSDLLIAQQYYQTLIETSDKMLASLRLFESQLLAMNGEKFDELILHTNNDTQKLEQTLENTAEFEEKKVYRYRGQVIEE
ncbi:MAG TPA: hypothetical protein ENK68_03945 [Epsilonproteobacteria bacterium]|nr:hypothetical protein [Campylobacterota bacterium]